MIHLESFEEGRGWIIQPAELSPGRHQQMDWAVE